MTVSDGDRFAIAMAKLSQARSAVYEATRIIEHLFESSGVSPFSESVSEFNTGSSIDTCDSITGLYPGQKPYAKIEEEEEEGVECLE
jgi:hypothetical protein